MRPRLPLTTQRLIVVTGKGGVGKTTIVAALARAAARAGRRVLAVEVGRGRLGPLLGVAGLGAEPRPVSTRLAAAAIEPAEALGDFVHGVLRFRVLARRLLESTSFQVLAAAAPGLPELLVLDRLHGWVQARRLGRSTYDLVVVDAPASGHSLPLLEAPRTLGALPRLGPVGDVLRRLETMVRDARTTLVCPVTTPEELAVRETVELYAELRDRLRLAVAPPIVNALPPRRFGRRDQAVLARLDPAHPLVAAAELQCERRRQAESRVSTLRRALGEAPVTLPLLTAGAEEPAGIATLADRLATAAGLAA